ncbi:hypothetical protein E1176_05190 [Fulvivirga sp. RKSG066]|uniref:DUF6438 domain-containing protein n=1 Tax=Fulvivirga aurantia TaxID=2529383 RepID=UPI0012BC2ECB|nr:DUF6438 domain-containing protein [Fulvivirga aurantia]MTI20410.1 hypothetical protein [Fulvivirga aurantia]
MKKVLIVLLSIVLINCKSQQIPSEKEAVVVMQKTPCMGSCPDYEIMIFDDMRVVLNARQHVGMKGTYTSEIPESTYHEILDSFKENNFFEYKDEYTSNITDMPTTITTFRYGGKEKKVIDYHGAPESLKQIEQNVHDLIKQLEWQMVEED